MPLHQDVENYQSKLSNFNGLLTSAANSNLSFEMIHYTVHSNQEH